MPRRTAYPAPGRSALIYRLCFHFGIQWARTVPCGIPQFGSGQKAMPAVAWLTTAPMALVNS